MTLRVLIVAFGDAQFRATTESGARRESLMASRPYRGPLTIRRQSSAGTKPSEVEPFTQDGLQRRTAHPMPGVPDVRPDRALRRARGRLTGAGLPRVPRRARPGARALAELAPGR